MDHPIDHRNHSTQPTDVPTRRQLLAVMAAAAGALVTGPALLGESGSASMQNVPAKAENDHRTSLHEEIEINAPQQRIYEALLTSKTFAAFTGAPANIDPKVGGAISLFGGLVVGCNVELVPSQRIVQAWRPTHWSSGIYSIARFALTSKSSSASIVVLDHTSFPEGEYDHLEWGWHNHYWEPLKKFLV